jgi:hypothetical protein
VKNFISDISRMRILKWMGAVLLLLIIIYLVGPTPEKFKPDTNLPAVTADINRT